jgi:hypothetical protein
VKTNLIGLARDEKPQPFVQEKQDSFHLLAFSLSEGKIQDLRTCVSRLRFAGTIILSYLMKAKEVRGNS